MHLLLRRPQDLRRATLAAVAAAALTILLTLVIAPQVRDLGSPPAASGAPSAHSVQPSTVVVPLVSHRFTFTPLTSPFARVMRHPGP